MNQNQIDTITAELVKAREHDRHLENYISELKAERQDNTEEIIQLKARLQNVIRERDAFKAESDNQAKAWAEIRTFIPDVNGLSMVGMVRRHCEEFERNVQFQYQRACAERERADILASEVEKLKVEIQKLKADLTLFKMPTTMNEKVFCVGEPIIRKLAASGQWTSDAGGLVAASDLFGNDPYSKISALECEVERHKREAKLQYEEAARQAERADENWQIRKALTVEIEELKANNRYQKGYGDGYEAARATMSVTLNTMPVRG